MDNIFKSPVFTTDTSGAQLFLHGGDFVVNGDSAQLLGGILSGEGKFCHQFAGVDDTVADIAVSEYYNVVEKVFKFHAFWLEIFIIYAG